VKLKQAWQSMRVMRRFTQAELLTVAPAVTPSLLKRYVRSLTDAGFLRIVQARVNGRPGSSNVYMLVRDTGPVPPLRHTDGKGMHDGNTGITYGADGAPITEAAHDLA
jgi:hypothetical protein